MTTLLSDDEQQDIKIGKITSHINDRTKLISEENSNQNSTSKKYQVMTDIVRSLNVSVSLLKLSPM